MGQQVKLERSATTDLSRGKPVLTSAGRGWPVEASFLDPYPERELAIRPHSDHKLILVVKPVVRLDLKIGDAHRSGRVCAGDMILMSARIPSVWH